MSLFGIHVKLLTDDQWEHAEAALKAAGHEVTTTVTSEAAVLWAKLKTTYPNLVTEIEKGIADLKDSTLSGGDRAVKVATDVLAILPEALQDVAGIRDLLTHGVTEIFADTVSEIKSVATELLAKL